MNQSTDTRKPPPPARVESDPWMQREEWLCIALDDGFCVKVKHWTSGSILSGPNRWNVYAIIDRGHPLFEACKPDRGAAVGDDLPLHGGCTWNDELYRRGELVAYEIGCDYGHYGDDRFSRYETREDAAEVFNDAERLFQHLLQLSRGKAKP